MLVVLDILVWVELAPTLDIELLKSAPSYKCWKWSRNPIENMTDKKSSYIFTQFFLK